MSPATHCPAVLAVELAAPSRPTQVALPTEQAAALVDYVATDFARLVPEVERLGLALTAALFDPAQILRPGWPVFAEMASLYQRERRGSSEPQIMAFGTAGGRMASPALEPEPDLGRGALMVLPITLIGEAEIAQRVGARMETDFHDQGLAGAGVSLFLQQALGLQVQHARYLTRHDLCALTAIQLDHAELSGAWQLLETALLTPQRRQLVHTPAAQAWCYADGGVRAAALGYAQWCRHGPGARIGAAERSGAFAEALMAQRQFGALFTAHGLPPTWVQAGAPTAGNADEETTLMQAPALTSAWVLEAAGEMSPRRHASCVVALHDPRIGVCGFAALADDDGAQCPLATIWPADASAWRSAAAALARACGAKPGAPQRARWWSDKRGLMVERSV